MEIIPTGIKGVVRLRPPVFRDGRGYFLEAWNQKDLDGMVGRRVEFVQDNLCRSKSGVLRGLHYQVAPMAQGKLVRVLTGKIFDVAVDLREDSPTRFKWTGAMLDDERHEMMWIPEGFAHGFLVLSESAAVAYKTTNYYSPQHERCVRWNDPAIGVVWPLAFGLAPVLSSKDVSAPLI
jgi:dTDP-4-dehydrorhamnose 3,5-epimerase